MNSKNVRFVLKDTLEELSSSGVNISGYRIAVESKIRPNSIYDILENRKKTISLEHLSAIRNALNIIAKEEGLPQKFDITDILQ